MPTIKVAMTPFPHSIESEASIVRAREMMREHDINHLPVMHEGSLVGVLSERDVRLVETSALHRDRAHEVQVREACNLDTYIVDVDAPLDVVLREMAELHLGSALVVKNDKLAGILTSSDAYRMLAELLAARFPPPIDDSAA